MKYLTINCEYLSPSQICYLARMKPLSVLLGRKVVNGGAGPTFPMHPKSS